MKTLIFLLTMLSNPPEPSGYYCWLSGLDTGAIGVGCWRKEEECVEDMMQWKDHLFNTNRIVCAHTTKAYGFKQGAKKGHMELVVMPTKQICEDARNYAVATGAHVTPCVLAP
jgi:hypothetical protein